MSNSNFIEHLMNFALTRQEASIYECLLMEGKTTGYEVAKQLGISRSNAYNSLASLTEKGGSYVVEEGKTKKYVPVAMDEFCKNHISELEESRKWLIKHAPDEKEETEGYITIEGYTNILNKIKNMLDTAKDRVYISCTRNYLLYLVRELQELRQRNVKVVIVTDQPMQMENFKIYFGEHRGETIGVIIDSKVVLTGEFGENSANTCLYSGQKFFVDLYKRALGNEIKLLALRERKED
ncbi:MAG TPA: HTH domain-containing protein [Candidatus Dorea intestinavium]|nr:HTH domain-containing protein [Candidatus Dorea intestinavium]